MTDVKAIHEFTWARLWGLDASEADGIMEGDMVVMRRQNGDTSLHRVEAVQEYETRRGERRIRALVGEAM